MIRLLLIDDHPVVRYGLQALLGVEDDINVIGTAGSGAEALSVLSGTPVDIVLLDLRMPGMSGLETLQQIKSVAPLVRTIILSSFECDDEIYTAVQQGAQGYIHKEAPAQAILNAIRTVYKGKQSFPAHIAKRLSSPDMSSGLSAREIEILALVAKGLTNKEAGFALGLSQFTVRNHLKRITQKMDVCDRTEAIYRAIQSGIITT